MASGKGSRAALLAIALSGQDCGGGSKGPAGSTVIATPAPTRVLTILSGETLAPVAGARVIVAGAEQTSDAAGQVTVTNAQSGLVDVIAAGYFDRQTSLGAARDARYTLWPRQGPTGLTESFTQEVVYQSTPSSGPPQNVPLSRWPSQVVSLPVVYLSEADDPGYLPFSPQALATQAAAIERINQALGGRFRFGSPVPRSAAPAGFQVQMRIFPGFEQCARYSGYTTYPSSGGTSTVTFCSQRAAERQTLGTHELGHSFGLRHSSDPADVMHPAARVEAFTPREMLVMSLMLQRPAGNRFPDGVGCGSP
jgi:hypothetical protein